MVVEKIISLYELKGNRAYEGEGVTQLEHALQSAHLAERMQRSGFEAYSFKGGVPALQKLGAGSGIR